MSLSQKWADQPRYVDYSTVADMLGLSRYTLMRNVRRGAFVRPVKIGRRTMRFDKYKIMLMLRGMPLNVVNDMTEEEVERFFGKADGKAS